MNIKAGVTGDIAYNYIWSAANNSIKLETGKTVLSPQTNMNIFNNTIVNGGWRKVGEATQGILIDKYAAANIFNNVLVGCHTGINIASKADTLHSTYGNNLIYAIDDSLEEGFSQPLVQYHSSSQPRSSSQPAKRFRQPETIDPERPVM